MTTIKRGSFLLLLLLLLGYAPSANCGQAPSQDVDSLGTIPDPRATAITSDRVYVVTFSSPPKVKRLKAGDSLRALGVGGGNPNLMTFLGRVLEVHTRGKGNKESLLLLSFDRVKFTNGQEFPVHLRLRAVVSPEAETFSFSPIIVDRYPCDYEADPEGCKEKEHDPGAQADIGGVRSVVCDQGHGKSHLGRGCVEWQKAIGVYGYPDFSLTPLLDGSLENFAITSTKRNIHLENGTTLVFSGPAIQPPQKPQS